MRQPFACASSATKKQKERERERETVLFVYASTDCFRQTDRQKETSTRYATRLGIDLHRKRRSHSLAQAAKLMFVAQIGLIYLFMMPLRRKE